MLFASAGIAVYCLFLAAVLGSVIASFLDCMAWRITHGESVWKGRSHCDSCGHVLSVGDLVPVFSYLFHHGKCRYCGCKLSPCHMIYELVGATAFVTLLIRYDLSLATLEYLLLAAILLGVSFTDIYDFLIPDGFVIAGAVLWVVFFLLSGFSVSGLIDSLIGGIGIALVLLIVVLVFEKIIGREAMGGGDLKLICMTGLYLGWQKNLLALLLACFLGIFTALLTQKKREQDDSLEDKKIFPWGPSIAAAAYLTLLFGDTIVNAYLGLF